jgi:hypothetical protein
MANQTVKNPNTQPLYVNLPGGRSLKIPARGQVEVEEEDLNSSEMALMKSRGNIILVEAATAEEKEGQAATGDEKSETKAEAKPQSAGKAMDEEGGKD